MFGPRHADMTPSRRFTRFPQGHPVGWPPTSPAREICGPKRGIPVALVSRMSVPVQQTPPRERRATAFRETAATGGNQRQSAASRRRQVLSPRWEGKVRLSPQNAGKTPKKNGPRCAPRPAGFYGRPRPIWMTYSGITHVSWNNNPLALP